TRGIHPGMYRDRLWTMRQYAGFGSAQETNARFRYLLDAGQTGLSCAFDLPTQMGYDSDHPLAEGEVGRVGVAIDSIEDMRLLLAGIPLDQVTTSMTINATAAVLLLLYELVAEEQGIPASQLRGTVQNDPLKEYVARGTYIYPPRASMRLVTDTIAYCSARLPRWNSVSVSGYHMREAGATASQELAFTLADGIAYVQAALDAGLDIDSFAPRLSFFFNAHSDLFEEVAKFRAARRMWFRIATERFGAKNEASARLRFHAQTAGSTLTAQQPEVNAVRVTLQALAAVLGGAQSLHTNSYDEALGLPSEASARLALRTQQVIAYESDIPQAVDPLGGSYYVEWLTEAVEAEAWRHIERIDELGGAVAAIETGYQQGEIERSAYAVATALERGEQVVVGVNRFVDAGDDRPVGNAGDDRPVGGVPADPRRQQEQVDRVRGLRERRDTEAVARSLDVVEAAAGGSEGHR
ncbi:MAG: methylmalonyl-CoA mutase family protein, partial [Actinobacteria bacterium]|nr:methylmalonyl-CoA mutase family protein [Actinomycetota bacterium]